MSEVPLNLTYKKTHSPRTLSPAYAWGPTGVLGGWRFPMSEVHLYGKVTPVILNGTLSPEVVSGLVSAVSGMPWGRLASGQRGSPRDR